MITPGVMKNRIFSLFSDNTHSLALDQNLHVFSVIPVGLVPGNSNSGFVHTLNYIMHCPITGFQNEVDVGKLIGPGIFPLFGSSEFHWYHFRRNPPVFGRARGPQSCRVVTLFRPVSTTKRPIEGKL